MIERRLPENSYRTKKNERFRFGCGIVGVWDSSQELLCCVGQGTKMAVLVESHTDVFDIALLLRFFVCSFF